MKINWLLKFLKYDRSSRNKGFTLTELLVGATISVVVIGAAGYALMESQKSSRAATTQVDARTEANRALTFMTDEIKEARAIVDVRATASYVTSTGTVTTNYAPPTAFNLTALAGKEVEIILALEVPHPTTEGALLPEEVIYYVRKSESPWIGPKVVYRWGPNFDAKGGYSASTIDDATRWQHEALVDQIPDARHGNPVSDTSCLSNDIKVIASSAGFGVCIDETKRSATILLSRIKDQKDWSSTDNNKNKNSIYTTQLKAFARGDDKDAGFSGTSTLTTTTASIPAKSPQPRKTIRLERLGSSYACNTTGSSTVATEVTVTKTDGTPPKVYTWNYDSGMATENGTANQVTEIPFDSTAGDIATYTSKYNPGTSNCSMNSNQIITESITSNQTTINTKVEKIENGKVFSTSDSQDKRMMENKYPNAVPAQETVTDMLKRAGYYDSTTKTVNIAQQVNGNNYTRFVYAFEMGPSSGNGFNEAGFDYQDNLILVTVAGDSL